MKRFIQLSAVCRCVAFQAITNKATLRYWVGKAIETDQALKRAAAAGGIGLS